MKRKILVVDDEKEIVDFLEKFLERFNIAVVTATTAGQALELYKEHLPEFVFLDIQMPDMDGVSLLKELKALNPKIKAIMITGKEEKEFQTKARKYGAIDYITKPLDLMKLSDKIKKHILAHKKV